MVDFYKGREMTDGDEGEDGLGEEENDENEAQYVMRPGQGGQVHGRHMPTDDSQVDIANFQAY